MSVDTDNERPRGLWQTALRMAEHTPTERNRYVDLLRALAIGAVIFGHWLVAAPWIRDGSPGRREPARRVALDPVAQLGVPGDAGVLPRRRLRQRPVLGVRARSRQAALGVWLASRVQRLVNPVLPLFLVWVAFLAGGRAFGVDADVMYVASSLALVPVWFLAVYLLVVAATPLSWAAWQRWGMRSFWASPRASRPSIC